MDLEIIERAAAQRIVQALPEIIAAAAALGGIPIPVAFATNEPNAYADARRHAIHLNPRWLAAQGGPFGRFNWNWRQHLSFVVGVVGHEVGHLVYRHAHGHAAEHVADGFAAHLLSRLGLDHRPFSSWLFATNGCLSHPGGLSRMAIHQNEWALETFFPNR